jgi:ELWxxDGT repeat protein
VQIDPGVASATSGQLSSLAPGLESKSSLHGLAARAGALALAVGTPATPVTLAANVRDEPETRSAALTTGSALAFGFQIILTNAPQTVPTLSGVVVLAQTSGGTDVVLGVGPSPGSAIPPALGILEEAGSKVWSAAAGQVSAQLSATAAACSGPPISGVTCHEATFSSGGLSITSSEPIAGGATGTRSASLTTQPLVGVSLTVDCALTTLCGSPANPGPASVFFAADDGVNGLELWETDGTPAGTVMVLNIHPTGSSSPSGFTKMGAFTYFSANDGTHGVELWKTDGTPANTRMVFDLNTGTPSSFPTELTVVGSDLYFTAQVGASGRQLYRTDGTSPPQRLTDPATVISASALQAFNGALYFKGRTVAHGYELWKADSNGAAELVDIFPGAGQGLNCQGGFTEYANRLYFAADNGTTGCELWSTNGTANDTKLVLDINPGTTGITNVFNLTRAGDILFFSANTPASGMELWKTDGTTTSMVKDIVPGTGGSGLGYFAALGSKLFFSCVYPGGSMLCVSDGTAAGTVSLQYPGSPVQTKALTAALGKIFFQASGASTSGTSDGVELWVTDGLTTSQVKDINPGGNSSFPSQFMPVGPNKIVFQATTAATGNELWVYDATSGGATLLKDILPGPGNGIPPAPLL